MEQILAGLGNRIFLMHNVHDDQPTLFETRWCMSYLRGPLTRNQIQQLVPDSVPAAVLPISVSGTSSAATAVAAPAAAAPALPQSIKQYFMPIRSRVESTAALRYQPMVLGNAQIGFRNLKANVQQVTESTFITDITDTVFAVDWDKAIVVDTPVNDLETTATSGIAFAALPAAAADSKNFTAWERDLKNWLYQTQQLTILQSPALKMTAALGESEREFRIRLAQAAREQRDEAVDKLRQKYAAKIQALEEKIRKSQQAVEREQEQAKQQSMQTAISVGATILSSFLGKKRVSASSLGRATTAVRGASRALKEKGDVDRSKDTVEVYRADLTELEEAFKTESDAVAASFDAANQELLTISIRPTKQDILVKALVLVWMPYQVKNDGTSEPAWF